MMEDQRSVLETKLEAASRLLRANGWTVLRPDPFRTMAPTSVPAKADAPVASIPVEKQEVKPVPAKKARPKREYKFGAKRGSKEEQQRITAHRLEVIRQYAGKLPSKKIAEMLGVAKSNLYRIACEAGISLKVTI